MNARVEKRYGGLTLTEIAGMSDVHFRPEVVRDLVAEIEATSAPEVVQRLRRMETKVHKIAVHVGAEPDERATMTLSAETNSTGEHLLRVPGFDVTLAQVRRMSERQGWGWGEKIYALHDSKLIATVRLTAGS